MLQGGDAGAGVFRGGYPSTTGLPAAPQVGPDPEAQAEESGDRGRPEGQAAGAGQSRGRSRNGGRNLGRRGPLALLDLTQHIVLVAAPELSAVKSAADAIDILLRLGTPQDRLSVVLNNRSVKPAVTRSAVERMISRPVDIEVGFDYSRPDQAAVNGQILSLTNPRSEITKGAEALADLLDAFHIKDPSTRPAVGRRDHP